MTGSVPVRYLKAEGTKVPDLHEPAYLVELRPKVGYYPLLNLKLNSYDYTIVEKYQSYLHKMVQSKLGMEVTDAWSIHHQDLLVENLANRSNAVEKSYNVRIYERNIQMKNALVTKLPILIDVIHSTLPPGVTFGIDYHSESVEERKYFKDSVLENLKAELKELQDTPLIGA